MTWVYNDSALRWQPVDPQVIKVVCFCLLILNKHASQLYVWGDWFCQASDRKVFYNVISARAIFHYLVTTNWLVNMCVFVAQHGCDNSGCNHTEYQTRTGLMSPYIWEYCMWQPANCLEGSPVCVRARVCMCVYMWSCLRVCTCVPALLHACSTLSQTLRWADRSVALQKCRALLYAASPASRAHTGKTNKQKQYTNKGGKTSPKRSLLHFCFFQSIPTLAILAMLPLYAPVE